MYYSITEARGTGSAVSLAVPPYLDKTHIKVYIDGSPTEAFAWTNEQTVSVIAPLNRLIRVVRRTSPGVRMTAFANGVPLPGQDLEVDSKQAFYLAQEAFDASVALGTSGGALPGGVELTTGGILDLLNGQITPSQLELDLRASIGLIKADASTIGSPAWFAAQEAAARAGALQAEYEARVSAIQSEQGQRAAAIANERTLRQDADGFLASQIDTVAAQVDGVNAAVQNETLARTTADSALASDIDTVIAYIDGLETGSGPLADRVAAVETKATATADRVTGVEAQWTVKVQARSDGKNAIAGIGINATANTDVAQSEMVFLADKFTFVPSMSDLDVIPQPLFVAGLVNGINTIVIPPSRYGDKLIEARMLVDGVIEARHVAANTITASMIDTRGLSIKDASGNVILAAGMPLNVANVAGLGALATQNLVGVGQVFGLGAFATVNQLTGANISTYIANAAISSAQVGVLSAANLTVFALSNTINGGASSGQRVEVQPNRVLVYDSSNVLRVKLGDLS